MSFINAMEKQIDTDYNFSITENGALGYATTNKSLLDMNFRVSSYRNSSEMEIISDFIDALNDNFELAVAWLFYARDVREGLGERRLFRALFKYLAESYPKLGEQLIAKIPEYGRWDDLMILLDTSMNNTVINCIATQLYEDQNNMLAGKSISLMAKWLPSENASSDVSKARAKIIMRGLKMTPKQYRQTLSALRKYMNIVESKMSANEWSEINYEAVPSKANLIYKEAFLKHDEDRRNAYLDAVNANEAKINSAANFPHEIAHKYGVVDTWRGANRAIDPTLEAMWKALPTYGLDNTIVVADGSGSMYSTVDYSSNLMAIEVANALAIYGAQHCRGEFKDKYITFSSRPQLIKLNNNSLLESLKIAYQHNEVANTNIKAVFELILRTAVNSQMKQEDLPQNILILSDMEFDSATRGFGALNERLFETISKQYAQYGYKLPRLIFWNICGRTKTIPVVQNDLGVALVSGFSLNIMKLVLSGEADPWVNLVKTLSAERYAEILNIATTFRNNT